jgi:hypothetical protein
MERLFSAAPTVPPTPTTDRHGNPTKWSIDRLDGRERVYSYVAAVMAAVFAVIVYAEEHHVKAHTHVKNQLSPETTLLLGLASAVALAITTRIGRRALVGFVALFTFLAFGNSALVLGFPFLALAVWLLFRSYKVQKEAAANVRAAKASGSAGSASTTGSPAARSTGKVETKGRAKKGPVTPEANKRYTPKRPAPPAPPPPKPSWRERRAAKAGD